jgi:hypothetical protein
VWGITSACEVAVRKSGDAVAPCLRSCLCPSPWYQSLRLAVQLAANGRPHQIAAFTCLAVFFSDAPISAAIPSEIAH